ncbi:hypothetical protein QE152_g5235 [Popillia japonica]|uniref:Uncharacterized protein n=1 Tax=Popillia japonica TaxID=7064 RepID=A0AAW1MQE0_POPJA
MRSNKIYGDSRKRNVTAYSPRDLVLLNVHKLNNAAIKTTHKFAPQRDDPYKISHRISPTTSVTAKNNSSPIGSKETILTKYPTGYPLRHQSPQKIILLLSGVIMFQL